MHFDRTQPALDATVHGLGVALESSTIAAPHILEVRLRPLFDPDLALTVQGRFDVYLARHAKRPEVEAFVHWLLAQAEAMPDPLAATARSARVGNRSARAH